jgi:hypothetical protein
MRANTTAQPAPLTLPSQLAAELGVPLDSRALDLLAVWWTRRVDAEKAARRART